MLVLAPLAALSTAAASTLTRSGDVVLSTVPVIDRASNGTSRDRPEAPPSDLSGHALPFATEAPGLFGGASTGSPDGVRDFTDHLANGLAKPSDERMKRPPTLSFSPDLGAIQPAPAAGARGAPADDTAPARQSVGAPDLYDSLVQQAMIGTARDAGVTFMFDPVFRPAQDQSFLTTTNAAGFSDFFVLGHHDPSLVTLVTYGGRSGRFLESTVAANSLPEQDWTHEQGYAGPSPFARTEAPVSGLLIFRFLEKYIWGVISHPLGLGGFVLAALFWGLWSARGRTGRRRA